MYTDLILDVDGVLTTGQFVYTVDGKFSKTFGPHDNDGIKLLIDKLNISVVTADKRGFEITKKRVVDDMGLKLDLVSEGDRLGWITTHFDVGKTIYIGDGMYDAKIFEQVAYSIAPANAFYTAKEKATFVTESKSGEGAVAEACLHILDLLD
jgi:3-deoxy-D-manno-octulosonate 8-phosphate phosphatase (KDO 8-P phosphatase)